jgi:ATP-dependent DNA helicase RecG
MAAKRRIFISSVQKELELERAAVASLITTDPFLLQHCEPVLFEKEPPAPHPARQPYLTTLRNCHVYVLVLANEYGQPDGDISATHHEYRLAQQLKLPTLIFIKGMADADRTRTEQVRALITETKRDGYTYKRFHDREDLKPEVLRALARALAQEFNIKATTAELHEGEHLIDAASPFETAVLADVPGDHLDAGLIADFNRQTPDAGQKRSDWDALHTRGLVVRDPASAAYRVTAAAYLLFAPQPANRYPQCEILVDAYDDVRISGRPKGQLTLNAALPHALAGVLQFIDSHTFHPRRVVGLNNLRLDEYPAAALREALVNAVAHRRYDDAARKSFVRVFSDRVEISSPGYPPQPLTLAKLRKGGYRPCSRNPLIAQTLATLGLMEQRGSGFARMQDAMLNHGLDLPRFTQEDGFFVVTLPGPAGSYDRLKVPAGATGLITPAVEAQLNERQKKMVLLLTSGEELTSRRCEKEFGVTRPVTAKDFASLVRLGLADKVGSGRSTRYRAVIVK